jgi:hypothetical protein
MRSCRIRQCGSMIGPVVGRPATSSGSAGSFRPCRRCAGGRGGSGRTGPRGGRARPRGRPGDGLAAAAFCLPVNTAPLSDRTLAGMPRRRKASWKVCSTSWPVMVRRGTLARVGREWSSRRLRISTLVPSASCQWWCRSASVRRADRRRTAAPCDRDDLGRFCGCAVTKPRRVKIRQIVETAIPGVVVGTAMSRSSTSGCDGQPNRPGGCGSCLRRRPVPAGTAPCEAGRSPPLPPREPPVGWCTGAATAARTRPRPGRDTA